MRQLLNLTAVAGATPGFVRLEDGQFLALTREFRRQLDDLRAFSQPGKGDEVRIHPLAVEALDDFVRAAKAKPGAAWKKQLDKLREAPALEFDEPPSTLQAELRPYQLEGFRWLRRFSQWGFGVCLADDMGLGKTVQALALLLERAKDGPALVVAPHRSRQTGLRKRNALRLPSIRSCSDGAPKIVRRSWRRRGRSTW